MAFGSPTSNKDFSKYQVIFTHTNGIQIVIDRFPVNTNADESDSDDAMLSAMALLDASPSWTFEIANKIYSTIENATP